MPQDEAVTQKTIKCFDCQRPNPLSATRCVWCGIPVVNHHAPEQFALTKFELHYLGGIARLDNPEPVSLTVSLDGIEERMKTKRKIIVYIATSADGYIARPDGDVEWLNRRPSNVDYGMGEFYPTVDTILWGRKTYDWLLNYYKKRGKTTGLFDTKVANYVFTHKPPRRVPPGVEFVSEPVKAFAERLRATPGKQIWMMGGGGLIASFLDAGEIDEFDIHVIPVFIGEGIPLVAPRHRDVPLRLRSAKRYKDGVVRLRYVVER